MNPTIRKTLVSGLGALIVVGAFMSVPAAARGGHGGGFFNFGDLASSASDNSDMTSGTVVSTTPLQPYNKPCHNETRKLYDDNDNIVAHQVVMVCPAK